MALDRKYQKIFGKNADGNDLAIVGSKNAGNPDTSTDVETIQSLSNWETGLRAQVTSNDAPYLQDQNSIFYVITSQLAYLFQAGIAEWNVDTEYISGRSVVLRSGKTYIAIANNTGVEPEVTSGWETYWKSLTADWGRIGGTIGNQKDLIKYVGTGYYAECNSSASEILKEITLSDLVLDGNGNIPDGTKITVCFKNGSNCLLYDVDNEGARAKLKITLGNGTTKQLYINVGENAVSFPTGLRHKKLFCPAVGGASATTSVITFTVYNKLYATAENTIVYETYNSNDWSKQYLDGYIEIGGIKDTGSNQRTNAGTINFGYTFKNNIYYFNFIGAREGSGNCAGAVGTHSRTTTSIFYSYYGNDDSDKVRYIIWEAKGYRA